jgi:hypothetical protein
VDRKEALSIIYALRNGMPPESRVRHFTVGREDEIKRLTDLLNSPLGSRSLLIQANSGSGKTHLLGYIKEQALEQGLVAGSVVLDSSTQVKLNRMDQIVAAVFREIQMPGAAGKGIRVFFDALCQQMSEARSNPHPDNFWTRLTNDWKWDSSDLLRSPCLYIALRAWSCGGDAQKDLIEDWLSYPWNYYKSRTQIVRGLIEDLKAHFTDPRPPSELYSVKTEIFRFDLAKYQQCWDVLYDFRTLSLAAGFKGFIVLFDEVEDIISNLGNLKWQKIAFRNLLRFFSDEGSVLSFFAVTPDFEEKCRSLLVARDSWAEEFVPLEGLPGFRLSPLEIGELKELARKIAETYGTAYGLEDGMGEALKGLDTVIEDTSATPVADRTRVTVKALVEHLDQLFGDIE